MMGDGLLELQHCLWVRIQHSHMRSYAGTAICTMVSGVVFTSLTHLDFQLLVLSYLQGSLVWCRPCPEGGFRLHNLLLSTLQCPESVTATGRACVWLQVPRGGESVTATGRACFCLQVPRGSESVTATGRACYWLQVPRGGQC